jgi:tetratricopeptide (TPR) repeat protein
LERSLGDFYLKSLEELKVRNLLDANTDELEQDDHNFVAALEGLMALGESDDLRKALRMASALFPYWRRAGRLSQGFDLASRVIAHAGSQVSDELVEALFRTGCAAHELYKLNAADSFLNRGEQLADELGIQSWGTESLRFRGELAANQERLDEGKLLLNEAMQRYCAAGDSVGEASCMAFLGYIARQTGNLDEARSLTEQAMSRHTAAGDSKGRIWCLGSLGAIYAEMGNFEQASAILTEALADDRRVGNLQSQAWDLTMLAEVALSAGDDEAASSHLDEALSIYNSEHESLRRMWPLRLKGEVLRRAGDFVGAEEVLLEAVDLSRAAGSGSLEAFALIRLSELKLSMHDIATAKAYQDAAAIIARAIQRVDVGRELALNQSRIATAERFRA